MTDSPRTFVLDTNVLLHDPTAIDVFEENDVVIPMTVLEEVDRFKKDLNETGRNARHFSRMLDGLRRKGSLKTGVPLRNGGRLWVDFNSNNPELEINWGNDTGDNRILRTVLRLHQEKPGQVALITMDVNMRLKCDALGVPAEDYQHSRVVLDQPFDGFEERQVPSDLIGELYGNGSCPFAESAALSPNSFLVLRAMEEPSKSAMARVLPDGQGIKLVGRHREGAWGVMPRNKEQLFALDLLLDPEVQLVTLSGMAGTGKTLLAIASAMAQAESGTYRKVLVSRPIFPLGRDVGYLPGDLREKLNPWMQPIFDNLEFLMGQQPGLLRQKSKQEYQALIDQGLLAVEALTYIRGRSIPEQYLIVDEAQNLTPHEVKTVLTRAGNGTKVVLTGDVHQIDNPYVDEVNCGLSHVIESFKSSPLAGHVTLSKGERSPLAEMAAKLL